MQIENSIIYIDGEDLRLKATSKGVSTPTPQRCCGGRIKYPNNYEYLLRRLGYKGTYVVQERGISRGMFTLL